MTEEQNMQTNQMHHRRSFDTTRAQARRARRAAKQAARDARHAARAQRQHRDWSFEVRAGEKVYTFTWRWHGQAETTPQPGAVEGAVAANFEAADGPAEAAPTSGQ